MEITTEKQFRTTVAARIAGEDIRQGDIVTVLNEVIELPSFLWSCSGLAVAPDEPVRVRYLPSDSGKPFKVTAVCLPFVYVKNVKGKVSGFDTRLKQLVRLDPEIGQGVWSNWRKQARKKQKKEQKSN